MFTPQGSASGTACGSLALTINELFLYWMVYSFTSSLGLNGTGAALSTSRSGGTDGSQTKGWRPHSICTSTVYGDSQTSSVFAASPGSEPAIGPPGDWLSGAAVIGAGAASLKGESPPPQADRIIAAAMPPQSRTRCTLGRGPMD